MSISQRIVAVSTTVLPLDQARQVLLPPVRLLRTSAVTVARTVRHWELLLEGDDSEVAREGTGSDAGTSVRATSSTEAEPPGPAGDIPASELPVQNWAELSYADAQSRLNTCDENDLRLLLDYERTHGHRPQYAVLLEQRLASSA